MKRRLTALLLTLFLLTAVYGASAQEPVKKDAVGPTPPAPPVNPETVLQYDDGSAEKSWSWFFAPDTEGPMLGVLFTPTFDRSWVTEVQFYLDGTDAIGPLWLHVYYPASPPSLTPLVSLYLSIEDLTGPDDWKTVDLSSDGVVVTGDFFIALEWTVPSASFLGIDHNDPNILPRRSWYNALSGWSPWPYQGMVDGDWLIRAVIIEVPGGVIPEFPFGTVLGLLMCMAALAVYKVKPIHLRL